MCPSQTATGSVTASATPSAAALSAIVPSVSWSRWPVLLPMNLNESTNCCPSPAAANGIG
jgi:hypothetical protein